MKLITVDEFRNQFFGEIKPSPSRLRRLIVKGEIAGRKCCGRYYIDIDAEKKNSGVINPLVEMVLRRGSK